MTWPLCSTFYTIVIYSFTSISHSGIDIYISYINYHCHSTRFVSLVGRLSSGCALSVAPVQRSHLNSRLTFRGLGVFLVGQLDGRLLQVLQQVLLRQLIGLPPKKALRSSTSGRSGGVPRGAEGALWPSNGQDFKQKELLKELSEAWICDDLWVFQA